MKKGIWKWSPFRIITAGFSAVVLLGTVLLMLPVSTYDGRGAGFIDALFTAVSATCVTGLIVQNTVTYWSGFGQFVILALIQTGGMGVVTLAVAVAILSGKRIGLMQRSTMQESIAAPGMGGIVRMTAFIVRIILIIELTGALIMYPVFADNFGWKKGVWYAVFHSVSAFCNAGFDLLGSEVPYASLVGYTGNVVINVVIMLLIIIGGIGFMTWDDIRQKGWKLRQYRLQSKVILMTSFLLILLPTLFFYFLEFAGQQWSGMSEREKILAALFQAVTPRTAGFNSVDLTAISESGQAILILLMLVGGAPGSTAGGMKVTTFAVLIMTAFAVFRKRECANGFGRRIPVDCIKNAVAIASLYLFLFILGALVISRTEGLPIITCLFETASAIGTVGLTLGITPNLSSLSQVILITMMFIGRVGGLTLIFSALSKRNVVVSRLPQEKITVG